MGYAIRCQHCGDMVPIPDDLAKLIDKGARAVQEEYYAAKEAENAEETPQTDEEPVEEAEGETE